MLMDTLDSPNGATVAPMAKVVSDPKRKLSESIIHHSSLHLELHNQRRVAATSPL